MKFFTNYSSDEDLILDISRMTLSFQVDSYKNDSLRSIFVNYLSSPFSSFGNERQVTVLEDISFQVRKGERVGIMGNNGAGKSSLCRMIAGIYGQSKGIKKFGEVTGIFDTEVAILPELTGRENLQLLTHLFFPKLSKEEKRIIIQDAEDFCDLGNFLDSPFKIYSKGMRARLFLSLISTRGADLLILDEVFNGADYFFSEKMSERIKKAIFESNAVLFVSHSEQLIREVCNRVIVFKDKRIAFDGPTKEAIDFYRKNCNTTEIVASRD